MDPDANLEEQRSLAAEAMKIQDACSDNGDYTPEQQERHAEIACRLAELVQALDEWIMKGGFLPKEWRDARTAS
jgi:hypothetical protein